MREVRVRVVIALVSFAAALFIDRSVELSRNLQIGIFGGALLLALIIAVWLVVDEIGERRRWGTPVGLMPLKVAAEFMYNSANGPTRRSANSIAGISGDELEGPADLFVSALFENGANGIIKIFGRRSVGLHMEQIPQETLKHAYTIKDRRVVDDFFDGALGWMDPCVSKRDALRTLKKYSEPKRDKT